MFDRPFDLKPLMIAERFCFHQRVQSGVESVAEYVAELKWIAANYDFGDKLKEALRDRLVCGLKNNHIQHKLLTEPRLMYAHAVVIALRIEAAKKNYRQLKGNEAAMQQDSQQSAKVGSAAHSRTQGQQFTSSPCHRCGWVGKFREATCHFCHKKGHLQ